MSRAPLAFAGFPTVRRGATSGSSTSEQAAHAVGDGAASSPACAEEATLVEQLLMGLGILLGLCGSIMINVGNNVQALGMGLDAAQQDLDVKERSKRPKVLWITGTVTFIVGSVINFVAFVFAAASVLAPLEAIQFVSNLVFARFVTKVPVSRRMVAGSALIVAGTAGAVRVAP